jgi:hypothetical protein
MNETAHGVAADQTQHIQNQKNHENRPKHFDRPPDDLVTDDLVTAIELHQIACHPEPLQKAFQPAASFSELTRSFVLKDLPGPANQAWATLSYGFKPEDVG